MWAPPSAPLALAFCSLLLVAGGCEYEVRFSRPQNSALGGSDGSGSEAGAPATGGATSTSSATTPLPATLSWQWQTSGSVDTTVNASAFVVDLFDADAAALSELVAQKREVICLFSAGTLEPWRSDVATLSAEVIGNASQEAPRELWLDHRSTEVRDLMAARLDYAKTRGCSAVLPDAIDGYNADTGFPIGPSETLAYLAFLAAEAQARQLPLGLSGAAELVAEAVPLVEFVVQSRCLQFGECATFHPFIAAGKPVLHIEYVSTVAEGTASLSSLCAEPSRQGFSTIVKSSETDAWRLSCD